MRRPPTLHSPPADPGRRRWLGAGALLLAGCAAPRADVPLRFTKPVVLLGEVHDHPQQHALRLAAFREHLAGGARPALLMEQFDRPQQAALDAALAAQRGPFMAPDVQAVLAAGQGAGRGAGWHWPFYEPFVALAMRHDLPVVAVNVGRDEARAVMRDGLAAHGFDAAVPEAVTATLAAAIRDSHCGLVDEATARRMALAQVARDQQMARALMQHAARGAVLLAGNGHVRTDVGAARWLDAATRARSEAIGFLEEGDATTAFDRIVFTPPHPRPDPCAAMRAPARR
ncbi:MAG: ChaN family lipoprotein [Rubrivivax sp.]|nr:ChaN family lipoprotein [Rubrivivax sp.]